MYRPIYLVYRIWTGTIHWARRRFTSAGYAVLGGLVFSAMNGFDTEKSLTYQVFAFLFISLCLSMAWSLRFRARFSAERRLPRHGSAGQSMPYRIVVRNESGKRQAGLVVLDDLADPRPTLEEFVAQIKADDKRTGSFRITREGGRPNRTLARVKESPLPELIPGGETEVDMELTAFRRGIVRLTGVSLGRPDPIGLFKAFASVPLTDTVLILPKRYALSSLAMPGMLKYQQGGVAMASSVGQSDEFVSLREYRPGDPLRHIHWRSWARTGEPIVKEYEDEYFVRHALILDTFTDEPESLAFEEAVSVAASFACSIQTQESLLDLLFVGTEAYCFTAGRGVGHTEQLLEILAGVRVCFSRPFEKLSNLVLDHAGAVSGCIVILLSWDDIRQELIKKLKLLGVPLMVLVVVKPGGAKTIDPGIMSDDPEHFHVLETGKIEDALARL
jgi:uncharacterized protein (DUF58 family)